MAGEAHKFKVPQVLRQGGGSDLVRTGVNASEVAQDVPKIWLGDFLPNRLNVTCLHFLGMASG